MSNDEPAGPASRATILGLVALGLMLLVGAAMLLMLRANSAQRAFDEARTARDRAREVAGEAARAAAEVDEGARKEAEAEEARAGNAAEAVAKSIDDLLTRAAVELDAGHAEAGTALLDAAASALHRAEADLSIPKAASLHAEAGRLYEQAKNTPAARKHIERALRLLSPMMGDQHPETRRLKAALGRLGK